MDDDRTWLPPALRGISVEGILRVDLGLEGDWSGTVVPIWSRESGFLGFEGATHGHATHRPSLELYFERAWIGLHCFRREGDQNVLDETAALRVISWIENELSGSRGEIGDTSAGGAGLS